MSESLNENVKYYTVGALEGARGKNTGISCIFSKTITTLEITATAADINNHVEL